MGKRDRAAHTKRTPISGYTIERHLDVYDMNDYLDKPRCTMFGRPAQQAFSAFFVWEKLLGPLEFKRFIEVGTGYGNASIFFMLHCVQKEANFITCEKMKNRTTDSSPLKKMLLFHENCIVGNVYGPAISQFILEQIAAPGRTVLFLDGGDKPHEFRLFAPALKRGDVVAVHDWGRAIMREWVQDVIDAYDLQEIFGKENVFYKTLTAMFRRKEET